MEMVVLRDNYCDINDMKETLMTIDKWNVKRKTVISKLVKEPPNKIGDYPISNFEVMCVNYEGIATDSIDKMRIMYSIGYSPVDFRTVWDEAVNSFCHMDKNKLGYLNILWLVGIGVLLEVPKDEMKKLQKCIERQKINDFVLNFLINVYLGYDRKLELCFEKENPYKKVVEIIKLSLADKEKGSERLIKYMKSEWFKGHYDYDWKNAHNEPGYYGFWSFETAAIAKILGLDDSKLKDSNHYPYDFAHYKDNMSFDLTKIKIKEEQEEIEKVQHVLSNPNLDNIIPNRVRVKVDNLIKDYNNISEKEFWEKYNLQDIWFMESEYEEENEEKNLLGFLIVNELVDLDCVLQLDYKEDLEDYIDNLKNFWNKRSVKLINFDLDNDQNYYMYVPKETSMKELYEVKIENVKR